MILHGHEAARERLISQLNEIGYPNAHGYSSGREARRACKNNPPDILIVSSDMSDVSTVELVQHYRINHPYLRVVLTSGIATIGEGLTSLEKLADTTLISPIGMWELRQTMRIQQSALNTAAS